MNSFVGSAGIWTVPIGKLEAMNEQVATEPFPKVEGPVQEVSKGFARDVRRNRVVALRVLFGNDTYPTGCIVYVNSNQQVQPWAKERFTFEETEQEFILVPQS